MEFKEAMRIWMRMCEAHGSCMLCPIVGINGSECRARVSAHPEKYESILAEWATEHPERTIADDFFEKHPRAKRGEGMAPTVCAEDCGYVLGKECKGDCAECWRRPLAEVEG